MKEEKGGICMTKKQKIITVIVSLIIVISVVAVILCVKLGKTEPVSASDTTVTTTSTTTTTETTTTQTTTTTTTTKATTTKKITTTKKPSSSSSGQIDFLRLINTENTLDESYVPKLKTISSGQQVDERIYDDLKQMLDDAKKAGYNPLVCSAYRSYDTQVYLYNRKVNQYKDKGYSDSEAKKLAGEWVAKPGTSEHQSGLAVDLVSVENQNLDDSQLKSKCQQWYMNNCWKYGFVLRYPSDKKNITKINSEPWHYRYVGKGVAKDIHDSGLCLEEYLAQSKN